ncbi:MAG TPA: adenylate/guanylate cyclase domain-containing protein [Nocardioidaceae bacterium]|nr:adenylate/guanylate cyclase domain-containing protein [Nocardioidaceae bacterium]
MTGAARRVLSILFADLVGFTELAERLDPEDVAAIQQEYFARAHEAIVRHRGNVEKYIGDAVVGSFGVPYAADDDAEQAVRAGLDIAAALEGVTESLQLPPGALQVRVGVNTGEVITTPLSGDAGEGSMATGDAATTGYRITGDAVNVAARLQARARPGTVLVGPETALAVEPSMVIESAGTLSLKGKRAPVPVWHVVEPRAVPSREWALRALQSPTVGREEELGLLEQSWSLAATQPQTWLVTAPPGVGKTRLVTEFGTRVGWSGSRVWTATVTAGHGSGYDAVAQLIRSALGSLADAANAHGQLVARLARHGYDGPRARLSADHALALVNGRHLEAEPAVLHSSWVAVLDTCGDVLDVPGDADAGPGSDTQPPVWVIEDLHHAGDDLLAWLREALTRPHRRDRMVVVTTRPSLAGRAVAAMPGVCELQLTGLGDTEVVSLLDEMLGSAVLPSATSAGIAEASGGNPLFVEELLRSWTHTGVLQPHPGGGWRFTGTDAPGALPTTVQSVYLGQVDGLPDTPRQVLHSGSIPGRTFPARALPDLDVPGPDPALRMLTDWGLLVGPHAHRVDDTSYTYRHGLLREVAYATLPRLERARLHLRFARWVEALGSVHAADEVIGTHLESAYVNAPALVRTLDDDTTKEAVAEEAASRLESAAGEHLASAPQRAAQLLERALALTPTMAPQALSRRLALGEALRRSGRLEEAMTTFVAAGDAAGAAARPDDQAFAALRYEDALFASRLPRSRWGDDGQRLLNGALAATANGADDVDTRVRLLAALGRARTYAGEVDTGVTALSEAVSLARRSGSAWALAAAVLAQRATQTDPAHLHERLAGLDVVIDAAVREGDRETELEGSRLQLIDLLESGDVTGADRARRRAGELILELQQPLHLWYPAMWAAMRALLAGDADAAALVEDFREEGTRWHYGDVLRVHAVQALELHTLRGAPEHALPLLRQLKQEEPLRWAPVLAAALARAGGLDEARTELAVHAPTDFRELPDDLSRMFCLALYAECADTVQDPAAGAVLRRLIEPCDGHAVVLGAGALCLGAASHYQGLAARAAGDHAGAVELFAAAASMNESMHAGPASERSRRELARTQQITERTAGRGGDDVLETGVRR